MLYRGRLLIVAWESIGKVVLSWRLDAIDKLITQQSGSVGFLFSTLFLLGRRLLAVPADGSALLMLCVLLSPGWLGSGMKCARGSSDGGPGN